MTQTSVPATGPAASIEPPIAERVAALSLKNKVRLLTGSTAWRMHALDQIGLRSIAVSDGPVGVRGTDEIPGATSLLMPSPSALAATWNLADAERVGLMFATEARRLGVDVVLAPQVNIQRTPVGGRHFECYSEDPYLTRAIAGATVSAMQRAGVGACLKHYVANDSETARTQYVSRVDEQALREVYLAPFEDLVTNVGAWSIMAGYNGAEAGGEAAPMTEHHYLLTEVLKGEWGFDGVVMSDWMATNRTAESANGGLDLVMPGPGGPWEAALLAAVEAGEVTESVIDEKVARILLLAARVGALAPHSPIEIDAPRDDSAYLRSLAAKSTVVLKGLGTLPVARDIASIALVGPNAVSAYVLGGGSSTVHPHYVVSPLEGIRAAYPNASVSLRRGGSTLIHTFPVAPASLAPEVGSAEVGVRITDRDATGSVIATRLEPQWSGWRRDLPDDVASIVLEGAVRLRVPGSHRIELGAVGTYTFYVDGALVARSNEPGNEKVILNSSVNAPAGFGTDVVIDAPRDVPIRVELEVIAAGGYGRFVRAELRHQAPAATVEEEIQEAVDAARSADLTVVVVGTNAEVESEGFDRSSLALPGHQDELVERILDAAPDAIVVVNAGSPLLLPWMGRAHTVLWSWFPGQECGHALADVLSGVTEPAGRLPWTLPGSEADVPVPDAIPDAAMVLAYGEGVHVGYRGWERSGATPAAPFGHGLGWTTWEYDSVALGSVDDAGITVAVTLSNTGPRRGTEVLQAYVRSSAALARHIDRPVRWLGGFATHELDAGSSATVDVTLPRRAFEVWDSARGGWILPEGNYAIEIGRSIRDIRLTSHLRLSTSHGSLTAATQEPRVESHSGKGAGADQSRGE